MYEKTRDPVAISPSRNSFVLRKLGAPFLALGPMALPIFVMFSGLLILSLFRAGLTYYLRARFVDTPEFLWLFPIGVRMDVILLSYITIVPALLFLILPQSWVKKITPFVCAWFSLLMCVVVYMEIATFPFIDEFDLRPDQKFLEYLHHVHEVVTTLVKVYKLYLLLGFAALCISFTVFWKSTTYIARNARSFRYGTRLVMVPVCIGLLFLGARSTLRPKPANLSTAAFSTNHLANELALNSTYSLAYAAYRLYRHEKNPSLMYGKIERQEVLDRVKKVSILSGEPVSGEIPFLQTQRSPFTSERPKNVVIFLQESVGADDVGCLSGPDVTPNMCRLKDEGLWMSNLYATGTRTVRGIEATVTGFLPTAAQGVIKLERAKTGFFNAASLFKEHGYSTEFFYGGESNFDEMKAFFLGNGFSKIYDQPTYESPHFTGTWGVSDEDLVRKANEVFVQHGDKPFFALMLSVSNHLPYEFPDDRIQLYEQPKQTHRNAVKYADYAIGLFFELAKKEKYFENTIFLVVADHNSHVKGNDYVPISKYHIPGFIIGPNVPKMDFSKLSSQVDLLPTLVHFSGLTVTHPLIGRNLMTLPPEAPGRAFMQFGEHNAYRVGDDVIVLRPFVAPEQFVYRDEKLVPAPLNQEMARDAIAHVNLPWILYSERLYTTKLPEKGAAKS